MKARTQIYDIFERLQLTVERQRGVKMTSLRMDNAKEYLKLKGDCEQRFGMSYTLTIKTTPEQYGIAERMSRTIAEKICCLLSDGNLPEQLRVGAAVTSGYCVKLLRQEKMR